MQICHRAFFAVICTVFPHFYGITFEVNDTNSRPSTSSSSGCIATVNDGLWCTVGEAAGAFHILPREFAQRLLIFFLFLRDLGDDPGVDFEEIGVVDIAAWLSSLCSTSGRCWTSTSSPRACFPLIQGTKGSSLVEEVDIMGFRTSLVSCSLEREAGTVGFFALEDSKMEYRLWTLNNLK